MSTYYQTIMMKDSIESTIGSDDVAAEEEPHYQSRSNTINASNSNNNITIQDSNIYQFLSNINERLVNIEAYIKKQRFEQSLEELKTATAGGDVADTSSIFQNTKTSDTSIKHSVLQNLQPVSIREKPMHSSSHLYKDRQMRRIYGTKRIRKDEYHIESDITSPAITDDDADTSYHVENDKDESMSSIKPSSSIFKDALNLTSSMLQTSEFINSKTLLAKEQKQNFNSQGQPNQCQKMLLPRQTQLQQLNLCKTVNTVSSSSSSSGCEKKQASHIKQLPTKAAYPTRSRQRTIPYKKNLGTSTEILKELIKTFIKNDMVLKYDAEEDEDVDIDYLEMVYKNIQATVREFCYNSTTLLRLSEQYNFWHEVPAKEQTAIYTAIEKLVEDDFSEEGIQLSQCVNYWAAKEFSLNYLRKRFFDQRANRKNAKRIDFAQEEKNIVGVKKRPKEQRQQRSTGNSECREIEEEREDEKTAFQRISLWKEIERVYDNVDLQFASETGINEEDCIMGTREVTVNNNATCSIDIGVESQAEESMMTLKGSKN
ncbi:hypothetical protein BDF20DRAFT_911442 [Mycotypha africana]|uniref:uncharacterized protein n=1 Tax=Mycotypha africana TaxID=64632 RepID=UPI002301EF05|nr:uncharacterized protein BDF20DRAFT_911442 [Mycotypha africana]KAI8984327.1 hypothetical protein BDF20DRAFT_911442 [Mycotypha africana]